MDDFHISRRFAVQQADNAYRQADDFSVFHDERLLTVLGEPGAGKSTEFLRQVELLRQKGMRAFYARLPHLVGDDMKRMLDRNDTSAWEEAVSDECPIHLFCDSLDEGRLESDTVHKELAKALNYPGLTERIHLRLACRTRDWLDNAASVLMKALGTDNCRIVCVLPLDEKDIELAAERFLGLELARSFLSQAERLGVTGLCKTPFLFRQMLEGYKESGSIGHDKTEIFELAVNRLLREEDKDRDRRRRFTPPQARKMAEELAVCLLFGAYDEIDLGVPNEKRACLDGFNVSTNKFLLEETLNTKLFQNGNRFQHRSFAEYLAAQSLANRVTNYRAWPNIRSLLVTQWGVPTSLRGLAGWLAQASPIVFQHLLNIDPLTLLEGDPSRYAAEQQTSLLLCLAERYEGRDYQNELREIPIFGQSIPIDLLKNLLDGSHGLAAQSLGLEIVSSTQRKDGLDLLFNYAMENQDNPYFRSRCVMMIVKQGTHEQQLALKPLLSLAVEQDPNDEIVGIVLEHLYPTPVNTKEALLVLHIPHNIRLFGWYQRFWKSNFANRIPDIDIPLALEYLDKLMSSEDCDPRENTVFIDLFDELFLRYLAKVSDLPGYEALLGWLRRVFGLRHYGSLQTNQEVQEWLKDNQRHRRALVSLTIATLSNISVDQFIWNWERSFLIQEMDNSDWEWCISAFLEQDDDTKKAAYFELACRIWARNGFCPSQWFETLAEMAVDSPVCSAQWTRVTDAQDLADNPEHEDRRQRTEAQREDREIDARNKTDLLNGLEKIRQDVGNYLDHCVHILWEKRYYSDYWLGLSPIDEIYNEPEITSAVADGLLNAWRRSSIPSFNSLWPKGSTWDIPYSLSKADFGLRLALERGLVNWHQISTSQRRAAIASALLLHDNLPDWFYEMYQANSRQFYGDLLCIIEIESCRNDAHPRLASRLNQDGPFQELFTRISAHYLVNNGWPENVDFMRYLMPAALRYPIIDWSSRLRCEIEASLGRLADKQINRRLLFLLAAWWRDDWRKAWGFARSRIFVDFVDPTDLAWFQGFFQEAAGESYNCKWDNIDPQALALLMPVAYQAIPGVKPLSTNERIMRASDLYDLRRALVNQLASSSPAEQALAWFQEWLTQPEFEVDRDWFLNIVTEFQRSLAEDQWNPSHPQQVIEVVFHNGHIIRNAADLFAIAKDLISTRLSRLLEEDHSPLPLLYHGHKDERLPLDEKAVQVLFYNQLRLLFEGYRIIGAREPEVWDQKKPDFRFSVILDSGEKLHLPIEVKKDSNDELKDAAEEQLLKKYMRADSSPYGILLVAWFNSAPKSLDGKSIHSPQDLEAVLNEKVARHLKVTNSQKRIAVIVVNCSIENP